MKAEKKRKYFSIFHFICTGKKEDKTLTFSLGSCCLRCESLIRKKIQSRVVLFNWGYLSVFKCVCVCVCPKYIILFFLFSFFCSFSFLFKCLFLPPVFAAFLSPLWIPHCILPLGIPAYSEEMRALLFSLPNALGILNTSCNLLFNVFVILCNFMKSNSSKLHNLKKIYVVVRKSFRQTFFFVKCYNSII